MENKEIQSKLINLQEENKENIDLITRLIERKPQYLPVSILEEKMRIKKEDKGKKLELGEVPRYLKFTEKDIEEIRKNKGVWIPKENFSYANAIQLKEISHYFDNNFIKKVNEYIKKGKELNLQKEYCQFRILTRPTEIPNPDEAQSYYSKLDIAKNVCIKMEKELSRELKILSHKYS